MEGTGERGGKGNTEPYNLSQVLLSNKSIAPKSAFAPCIEIREKVYFKHVKNNEEPQGKLAQIRKQQKKHQREKRCFLCKVCPK